MEKLKIRDRSPAKSVLLAVAAVLALTVVLPTALYAHNHETGKDAEIKQRVTNELAKQSRFANVQASVEDGIVDLGGTVQLYRDKLDAEKRTKKVDIVAGVRNKIAVSSSMPDAQLAEKLSEKLRYDRIGFGIMFNALTLGVDQGRVTIGGNVRDYSDRDSALAIVAGMPGVKDMIDEIDVAPVSGYDDDLRLRLARSIYGHPSMQKYAINPMAPIRIVVENGRVTLHGVVDSKVDKGIVLSQARSVAGSFEVNDNLLVR